MKKITTTLIILSISIIISAQVPKNVLLEYATNASCGPCASANPGNYDFLKKNYKNTVSVWYHAWWPGSNDPMYVANVDENAARINYYNINGVPAYVINGTKTGYGDEGTKMQSHHASEAGSMSPLDMVVTAEVDGDSVRISVTVKVLGEVAQSDLVLHTAVTEQMVIYPSPPGSKFLAVSTAK